jgi:hypothetical protein
MSAVGLYPSSRGPTTPLMTIGVRSASPAARISSASAAVGVVELVLRVAELVRPVRVGAPRCRVEDEADALLARDGDVGLEVGAQLVGARVVLEEVEGGEAGQVDAPVEDQRGLEATVGDEGPIALEVRKSVAITHTSPTVPRVVGAHKGG